MSAVADRVVLAAYRAGWSLIRRVPARLAYGAFDLAADVVWRRGGHSVERLRSNYALVRPELAADELDALVRRGVRSYLRYWCDAFRLPDLTRQQLAGSVRVVNDGPIRAHLAGGGPTVMFLGHLGNWDLGGAWSTTELAPVTTVAERLRPEELFTQFLAFREALGMRILPLTGGSDVFRELLRALHDNAFVALLADRDLTARGVDVDFCGHRARMAVGPAALALTTGAPLVPISITYERADRRTTGGSAYRIVVRFHDFVRPPESGPTKEKVRAMTQQCADALGEAVLADTEDWHMMQRVFVDPAAGRQGRR